MCAMPIVTCAIVVSMQMKSQCTCLTSPGVLTFERRLKYILLNPYKNGMFYVVETTGLADCRQNKSSLWRQLVPPLW